MDELEKWLKAERGRLTQLANALNIRPQTIKGWQARHLYQVPAERCQAIEAETGISRYKLRPDVYGERPSA